MWRGSRRQRTVACGAQVIALAASALTMLSVMSFAAEVAPNGRIGAGAGSATMEGALIEAYQNNPQLNGQRSATRAADENVPTALAGYRPRVSGTSSLTEQYIDQVIKTNAAIGQ